MQSPLTMPATPRPRFCFRTPRRRGGFTLIELLVVIATISFLMAMVVPAVSRARESARKVTCKNNLKQIASAFQAARDDCGGVMLGAGAPHTVFGRQVGPFRTAPNGQPYEQGTNAKHPARCGDQHASVFFQLLPHLDQENLWLEPSLEALQNSEPAIFQCPSANEHKSGQSSFAFNAGNVDRAALVGLILPDNFGRNNAGPVKLNYQIVGNNLLTQINKGRGWKKIPDGEGNTVLIAERALTPCNDDFFYHGRPSSDSNSNLFRNSTLFSGLEGGPAPPVLIELLECTSRAGANHSDSTNVAYVDGSVKEVSCDVDHEPWMAACSIGDRQAINIGPVNIELLRRTGQTLPGDPAEIPFNKAVQ